MEDIMAINKQTRMLDLYIRLTRGNIIKKNEEAERFGITERTLQRDIDDLKNYLAEKNATDGIIEDITYNRALKGYCLCQKDCKVFTNGEALAVGKILLESRAFNKKELNGILDKLVGGVPEENRKEINELLDRERLDYIEPRHKKPLVDTLWQLGKAVKENKLIKIKYTKLKDTETVERLVKPVGIMFSEFYFYLTAFIEGIDKEEVFKNPEDLFPTIYRIDRIQSFQVSDENFVVPYREIFQEGEFRKRIQFMTGGKLRRIKFKYSGMSIEAVLDRLPTAEAIEEEDGTHTVTAEVFGNGVDMWLRSQGNNVEIL